MGGLGHGPPDAEHPVTRGLHVGFRAPSRAAVDAFWQAGIDAGYRDDGAPGPRTEYAPDYYGGFLLDPDGNSAEAVHGERAHPVPDGRIDHLWIRVADLAASKRFYTTIATHAGIRLGDDEPGRVQFTGEDYSFSLIDDGRPLTEHVHLAFSREDATVRAFHAAALAAGHEDHGGPGERVVYHPRLLRRVRAGPRRAQRRGRQPQPLSHPPRAQSDRGHGAWPHTALCRLAREPTLHFPDRPILRDQPSTSGHSVWLLSVVGSQHPPGRVDTRGAAPQTPRRRFEQGNPMRVESRAISQLFGEGIDRRRDDRVSH